MHYLGAVGRFHPCQHLILVALQLEHIPHSHLIPGPPREIQAFGLTLTTCKNKNIQKFYYILHLFNDHDLIRITEIFRYIQDSSYGKKTFLTLMQNDYTPFQHQNTANISQDEHENI